MIASKAARVAIATMMVLVAIASSARAQITTGSVAGSVKDAQGAVIPGATVTLISESKGTRSAPVVTSGTGDFTIVNVTADTYTVEISMPSFKTLKRSGVAVNPGTRATLGDVTLDVGGTTETVQVKAEAAAIQATSGERSFTIDTSSVENLPIANRSFTALASLAPGVTTTGDPSRIGGGGDTNIMMDGVGVMDTGSNRPLLQMTVESIAEVKVLTSVYQAEYGRSSGLQISAVTKSGTNRFRGSLYGVMRDSDWYANSKANILNGNPKAVLKEKDLGYSVGGPIGKAGGTNKLFFFYSQEFSPRTSGNNVQRHRFPTALERAGDFSQTRDQNGNAYPYIKNPNVAGLCTAANQTACYADGGVLGRIPASDLYQVGLNILKQYPMPNLDQPGVGYNFEITRPNQTILAWQPAVRVDYQPSQNLRATVKFSGWQQRRDVINGSLPGFNDSQMQRPVVSTLAISGNYTLNTSTFIEMTYGRSRNELAGCALAQSGTGPTNCTSAIPMNPGSNRFNIGLGNLPLLFPDANKFHADYYATQALNAMTPTPPAWVDGDFVKSPNFSWGNRVGSAPPNIPFPGYFNVNATQDFSISMTKVMGRHVIKAGFFNTHSYKAEQATGTNSFGTINFQQDTVGTNPFDTSFGFANAAIGTFSSFQQASKYIEGNYVYDNREAYIQDNWKISSRLTLDYGMRFAHVQPQYDKLGQAANFLPGEWSISSAPQLYRPGCAVAITPTGCPTASQRALNPVTGQLLGPNSTLAIGTIVGGSGSLTNGLFLGGQGIAETTYTFPGLVFAPRFGMAYDVTGKQSFVLRGGVGLFHDRPFGNTVISMAGNPPASRLVTVRYGQLQALGSGGLTTQGPPSLNTIQHDAKLPSSTQFNAGFQMAIPGATTIDIEWVGQHSFNTVRTINLNTVDFGAAFLPQNQNPNLVSATQGGAAVSQDLMRPIRGYGSINHRMFDGWRTFHSLQMSLNRRFRDGLSFGFNDTWVLLDHAPTGARLQHDANGQFSFRSDQDKANRLLAYSIPQVHIFKANFVWDMPDLRSDGAALRAIGLVVNDWQLSGVWTGATGSAYSVGFGYSSGGSSTNLTGSPDYGARIKIVGDPGTGCSDNVYAQFNINAFQGPAYNSDGLESAASYLRGCFTSALDLSVARTIRLGGGRQIQLRVDMFNAPNAAGITGRSSSITFPSPNDPTTITNSPFLADGSVNPTRVRPANAGVGQVTGWQQERRIQAQVRFQF